MGRAIDRGRRAVALGLLALVLPACDSLLGLDEYSSESATSREDGGSDVPAACGNADVFQGGRCMRVGVADDACGAGFAPDGNGGCTPLLPDAACAGMLVRPGDEACVEPTACNARPSPSPSGSTEWFVRAGVLTPGRGRSAEYPFARIADALRAAEGSAESAVIRIGEGEYRETLTIRSRVQLEAMCGERVRVIGGAGSGSTCAGDGACTPDPVVTITADGAGSVISGLDLSGGGAGVSIAGASGVEIHATRIHDVDGPGVRADDRTTRASVSITDTLIEGARGAGVLAYGAAVALTASTVRGTRAPLAPGADACGVCVRPSGEVPLRYQGGRLVWDARASQVGSLEVTGSLLEDNAGAGISVIGVRDAHVTASVVRSTAGEAGSAQRIGIEAEERVFGNIPAGLDIRQSVVAGMSIAGIRARNAYVRIEHSSVRDIAGTGTAPQGGEASRCLGNGVRVLWDRAPDDARAPALFVRESAIERTREAGISIAGADAVIERSIIRDTRADACAGELGDGVSVHGFEFAPASLTLTAARVEHSARAALATFGGASLSASSSTLIDAAPFIAGDAALQDTWCRRDGHEPWSACAATRRELEPALLGGQGCKSDGTVCIKGCDLGPDPRAQPGAVLLTEKRVWILDHDEIAPVRSDRSGCYELEGLPRGAELLRAVSAVPPPGFVARLDGPQATSAITALAPILTPVKTDLADASSRWLALGEITYSTSHGLEALSARPDALPGKLDLSVTPGIFVFTCAPHPERHPDSDACRSQGSRVPNVSVQLDVDNLAHYPSDLGNADPETTSTLDVELGSIGFFVNVPPGERSFELRPAVPGTLVCNGDTGVGWQSAARTSQNRFRIVARPGFFYTVPVFCELVPETL